MQKSYINIESSGSSGGTHFLNTLESCELDIVARLCMFHFIIRRYIILPCILHRFREFSRRMDIPIRGCKSVLTNWLGQGYQGNQDRYSRAVWRRLVVKDLYFSIQCRWWNIHVIQQWPGTWHLLSSYSETFTILSGPHAYQADALIKCTQAWLLKFLPKFTVK